MKNNSLSKLTACLLVYNHAHIIKKVISNILNQTFPHFDLIISDDCSTDNSYEIAKSFEKIDERVNVIRTVKNLGMVGNAKYAIEFAKQKYIAILHHDDLLNKDTLEEWFNCIESNDKIAFVFNDYKTKVNASTNHYLNKKLQYVNKGELFLKKTLLKQWGCPVRGSALIRKKYYDEIGGLDEKFGMLADVDLWMRLAASGDIGYVNKPLIEVLEIRPKDYPKDYTEFSWKRIFLLFDIHSNNINRKNFSNNFEFSYKRFVFKNKVSFEIIKWVLYAVYKKNTDILHSYNEVRYKEELIYSKTINKLISKIFG